MMKWRAGQAGRIIGEALHQIGRIIMLLLILLLLGICLLGLRLSQGPISMPYLASKLATAASGQGITVSMEEADLAWAGYKNGGAAPLFLRLAGVTIRNEVGAVLVTIPQARLIFLPVAIMGGQAPILVNGEDARFPGSDVPVSLRAALRLGKGFSLARADIHVSLGAGRLGAGQMSLPITAGSFTVAITPKHLAVSAGQLTLKPAGTSAPQLGFNGAAALDKIWRGAVNVTVDKVAATDLPNYWPPPLAPLLRHWVIRSILAGTAEDASFSFQLTSPPSFADIDLTNVTGSFRGQGITLIWLPGAPPITAMNGRMTFTDENNALINADSAALNGLVFSPSTMRITGLDAAEQLAGLEVHVAGPVPDAIKILNGPPLNLLDKAPVFLLGATGRAEAVVKVTLPLLADVPLKDVTISTQAKLHDAAMASPFPGLNFTAGEGTVQATTTSLQATANAQFAGEPAHVTVDEVFIGGLRKLEMTSAASPAVLNYFGFDQGSTTLPLISGPMPFDLTLTSGAKDILNVHLESDFAPAAVVSPLFGWNKRAGAPGHASLDLTLNDGVLQTVDAFSATAPDLRISARRERGSLVFDKADIGRTIAAGRVMVPAAANDRWQVTFSGPALDVRLLAAHKGAASPGPASPPLRWDANLHFGTLWLAAPPAPGLPAFSFVAEGQDDLPAQAYIKAGDTTAIIARTAAGGSHVEAKSPDAGQLLQALGLYNGMSQGDGSLEADYGGAAPAEGKLTLHDFRLSDVPVFAKVLQAVTIYGIGEATSGPGLGFDTAVVPFSVAGDELSLNGARAFSTSLGFTASGTIRLGDEETNIDSTVVPAYAINALLGKIPLIGGLFTAEKGGGLFAVRAHITGPLDDPDVSVNPLSAFTPGALRGLFGLSEDAPPAPPAAAPPAIAAKP